jgi:hypothetical protein
MLRVTKELQTFIKGGDVSQKQKDELEKLEAKGDSMKTAHTRALGKLGKAVDRVVQSLREKEAENRRLEKRRRELEESVAMRQSILATRGGAAGDASSKPPSDERIKVRYAPAARGGAVLSCPVLCCALVRCVLCFAAVCVTPVFFKPRVMQAVMMRRKLVELAKTQTEEIDFLRKELERLRQRTFPSFAVVGK